MDIKRKMRRKLEERKERRVKGKGFGQDKLELRTNDGDGMKMRRY